MKADALEFVMALVTSLLYVAPSLVAIALNRGHAVEAAIVNAMLGWTIIGWGFALFLALHEDVAPDVQVGSPRRTSALRHAVLPVAAALTSLLLVDAALAASAVAHEPASQSINPQSP